MLNGKGKRNLLLSASYLFYGYWDYRFLALLLISTIADFIIGQRLYNAKDQATKKFFLRTSMVINLGILGVFKYFNFFVDSFNSLARQLGGELDFLHLNILLPVGISFYTFQTMSYTIDIYRERMKPTTDFLDFALFVAFFPQLVAGPIERAKALLPQIADLKLPTKDQVNAGIVLIIIGIFKKVMLGDTAGRIVDNIFAEPGFYLSDEILAALVLFSIQIYADFSGYSSIARGTAKLLGVELMINFEQPYLSTNITEFWRRWHISLSSWLRDYLYIFALNGNRINPRRTKINLFITMLLGGLWHGASWTFVIWGALHGLYLSIHKIMLKNDKPQSRISSFGNSFGDSFKTIVKIIGTYLIVLFAWLFFRASSFSQAMDLMSRMADWETSKNTFRLLVICMTFGLATIFIDSLQYYFKSHTFLVSIQNVGVRYGILSAMFFVTMLYMFQAKPMPFVYFQF